MTGRTFINNEKGEATLLADNADGSKASRNEYLGDPQKFLSGVLSGDVAIGGKDSKDGANVPVLETDDIDFDENSIKGIDDGIESVNYKTQYVDQTDASSLIDFDGDPLTDDDEDSFSGKNYRDGFRI